LTAPGLRRPHCPTHFTDVKYFGVPSNLQGLGFVVKAHILLYHSTLGLRVINKKVEGVGFRAYGLGFEIWVFGLRG